MFKKSETILKNVEKKCWKNVEKMLKKSEKIRKNWKKSLKNLKQNQEKSGEIIEK